MPFSKGISGNPSGRPKSDLVISELARTHTEDAITCLVEIMGNADAPPAARVSAAQAVLDRAWGRAPQALVGPDGGAIKFACEAGDSIAALMLSVRQVRAELGPGEGVILPIG